MTYVPQVTVFPTRYVAAVVSQYVDLAVELPIDQAFSRAWGTDAHFVPYQAQGVRLTKRDLTDKQLAQNVRMNLLVWDVDGPPHPTDPEIKHWYTPEWWAVQHRKLSRVEWIENIAWYVTRGGYRIVLAPPRPLRLAEWRALYKLRTTQLQAAGIVPDPQCTDWTRFYRLPRVLRGGIAVVEPDGDFLAVATPLETGARNGFLASVAGYWVQEGITLEVWEAWLRETNTDILDEPLPEEEVATVSTSIATYSTEHAMTNGGDAEIADMLIASLGQVVTDRDTIHSYTGGTWYGHTESELKKQMVERWEGAQIQGSTKYLRFTSTRAKEILEMVKFKTLQTGYFDHVHPGVVAFRGGVVWDHGQFRPGTPEDCLLWALDVDAQQVRTKPVHFLAFLEQMVPDEDSRSTLQEFMGATLVQSAVRYAKALFLKGEGANGKSVFCDILAGLLPWRRVCSISPQKLEHPYFVAEIAGTALNVVEELPKHELVQSETFKAVVSGSRVEAARKFGQPFAFQSHAACLFAGNNLPAVSDFSWGFWRRVLMVEFPVILTERQQDIELAQRLLRLEKPMIAGWALEGASRLIQQGHYTVGTRSLELIKKWRHTSDSVSEWVSNRGLERFPQGKPIPAMVLLQDYRTWAQSQGLKPLGLGGFQERLMRLGLRTETSSSGGMLVYMPGDPTQAAQVQVQAAQVQVH